MNLTAEKIVHAWLVFSILVLATFAAWVIFGNGGRWLQVGGFGNELQASQAAEADLLRHKIRREGQHGPVAAFADLESDAFQFQHAFLQPAPDRGLASDGFRGGTDHRQRRALVLEVGNEGDFYFSVLVSQGHWLLNVEYDELGRIVGIGQINRQGVFVSGQCDLGDAIEVQERPGVTIHRHGLIMIGDNQARQFVQVGNRFWNLDRSKFLAASAKPSCFHEIQHTATAHFGVRIAPTGQRRFSPKAAA